MYTKHVLEMSSMTSLLWIFREISDLESFELRILPCDIKLAYKILYHLIDCQPLSFEFCRESVTRPGRKSLVKPPLSWTFDHISSSCVLLMFGTLFRIFFWNPCAPLHPSPSWISTTFMITYEGGHFTSDVSPATRRVAKSFGINQSGFLQSR